MQTSLPRDHSLISLWLFVGVAMVFIQILLGGITRLTGSGLSITRWEIVTGSLPPLSKAGWEMEFDRYKATPQFQKINRHFDLSDFKSIYIWEYLHRLWARLIGIVFLVPFFYFLLRKKLNRSLIRKSLTAFLLGGLVGLFGWIMVK